MQNISKEVIAEIAEYAATLERGIALAVETEKPAIESYFRAEVANARAFLAQNTPEPPKASKAKCGHASAVRAFFGAAKSAGLDTNEDRSRGAVSLFLGHRIESRAQMNGKEWSICADAIRDGRLFW
jgi:hypothetical protein